MNPVALVGEAGAGKSWLFNFALARYLKLQHHWLGGPNRGKDSGHYYMKQTVFFQNTSADAVARTLDLPLEKKSKSAYAPREGKKAIYFIDDLTMCI